MDEYIHRRAYRSGQVLSWGTVASDPLAKQPKWVKPVAQCGNDVSKPHRGTKGRGQAAGRANVGVATSNDRDFTDSSTASQGSRWDQRHNSQFSFQVNGGIGQLCCIGCLLYIIMLIIQSVINHMMNTLLQ